MQRAVVVSKYVSMAVIMWGCFYLYMIQLLQITIENIKTDVEPLVALVDFKSIETKTSDWNKNIWKHEFKQIFPIKQKVGSFKLEIYFYIIKF